MHLRLSSYGSKIYVCVRESWARSMRTCALALRVQVRHKYMLSTCEKPIVICVQLLMKQTGDFVMHVMAATVLSVVKAPLGELGLDQSTRKPVHRAKRARAVRSVFSGCMGSFKQARAVLPKIVVPSTKVALMRLSCALHAGTTTADLCNHLAGMAIIRRPLRSRQPAPPLFAHQLEKMALAVDEDSTSAGAEPVGGAA